MADVNAGERYSGASGGAGRNVLIAPDAFKGTATAAQIAAGLARGATRAGWVPDSCPLSDGGEGFLDVLDVLGGEIRSAKVTGPLGEPVDAEWRLVGELAIVESARASGLVLAGGTEGNDPIAATSRGTGELIVEALRSGAERVLIGVGGSATTDGGAGALEALDDADGLRGADVVVACDVTVRFLSAAEIFGPQKGAGPEEILVLNERLRQLLDRYRQRGVDVEDIPGGGAAGGLAGGLVVAGARIVPGLDLVGRMLGLDARVAAADLVVTGEGRLDPTSWEGKVVGGVAKRAALAGRGVFVVAGEVARDAMGESSSGAAIEELVSLSDVFGTDLARTDAPGCAELVCEAVLIQRSSAGSAPA